MGRSARDFRQDVEKASTVARQWASARASGRAPFLPRGADVFIFHSNAELFFAGAKNVAHASQQLDSDFPQRSRAVDSLPYRPIRLRDGYHYEGGTSSQNATTTPEDVPIITAHGAIGRALHLP